jgi:hypothetical protein
VKTEKSIDGALLIDPVRTLTQICFFPFQATSNKQQARSKKQEATRRRHESKHPTATQTTFSPHPRPHPRPRPRPRPLCCELLLLLTYLEIRRLILECLLPLPLPLQPLQPPLLFGTVPIPLNIAAVPTRLGISESLREDAASSLRQIHFHTLFAPIALLKWIAILLQLPTLHHPTSVTS